VPLTTSNGLRSIDDELPLRERKKARTRKQLIEASQRLFLTRGYEATTLEQICAEVEIRTPTLLRYFPSKVELALAPSYDAMAEFRQELAERAPGMSVIEVWRHHIMTMSALADSSAMPYFRMLGESSVLVAGMGVILEKYEDALADELSKEGGVEPTTDLHARMLATLLVRGNQSVFRSWMIAGQPSGLLEAALAVVDFAHVHLPQRKPTDVFPWKPRRRTAARKAQGR
jgi:AcrR family transcriptional regulator